LAGGIAGEATTSESNAVRQNFQKPAIKQFKVNASKAAQKNCESV
jgi:hypothetical protein